MSTAISHNNGAHSLEDLPQHDCTQGLHAAKAPQYFFAANLDFIGCTQTHAGLPGS